MMALCFESVVINAIDRFVCSNSNLICVYTHFLFAVDTFDLFLYEQPMRKYFIFDPILSPKLTLVSVIF